VAAVGARTAAMSLNRLIDRHLDARNPRTLSRELPAGRMKLAEAVALLFVALAVYVAACAALGRWYVQVAWVPIAVFATYPYLKRFTPLCHAGVGASMGLALLAGYAAAHPDLARLAPALWLFGFAVCWGTGFDIIYATLDEASDRTQGVHSMVVWLGREGALRVSAVLHVGAAAGIALGVWCVLGGAQGHGGAWLAVLAALFAIVLVLLALEQRWAERVNLAFFKINVWVGAAVLVTVCSVRMAAGGF